MLRVCSNVEDALALSKRWQVPLLVFVHSALPETARADADADAVDLAELYTTSSHGRKTIKPTFRLGRAPLAGNGAAQRNALEAVLQESRLGSVTVVHFVGAGSAAHNLFVAAVPEASASVPRLHVFPPSLRERPRSVLSGHTLTPGRICEALRVELQTPPPAKLAGAKEEFMRHVEEVSAATAAMGAGTGAAATHAATASPGAGCGGPAGLHFVALNGLERREVVATAPGMTLRTVWVKVQQALERERERQAADEAAAPRGSTTSFVLRVDPPATAAAGGGGGAADQATATATAAVVVDSVEAAAKLDIHALPHNTTVTVLREGASAESSTQPAGKAGGHESPSGHDEERKGRSCDGGVCRLRGTPPSGEPTPAQPLTPMPAPPTVPAVVAAAEEEATPPPPPVAAAAGGGGAARIHVRCSLPSGGTHTVDGLDPATASLSAHLRGPIAELLGHSAFAFARVYPPHRFSSEEEAQPLEALGMRTSSALRVVPTGGPPTASPARNLADASKSGLFGLVSSLLRRGSGPTPAPAAAAPGGSVRDAARARFGTMAELRAKEEEEEKRAAAEAEANAAARRPNEPRRRKANRYYGGSSTEYTGWDGSGEEEAEEEK
ncbi:uncharacterized protein Tco025E_08138 [Trypanosoma conorhini]|uniref:UBX domain-containing protein n=1 Tax=Trypanosoma conorhini TaxID=83891 RepID=A0A3R7KYZ0_9TRYP|nr:uncharacterized protein Tco025E_08138 [Trypanosoma conorhini]RNF04168.1 hypothetical protein Tco025E_08138 [Trypanosoma conorhini]